MILKLYPHPLTDEDVSTRNFYGHSTTFTLSYFPFFSIQLMKHSLDDDECAGTNPCVANAACTNNAGGYTCACKAGYTSVNSGDNLKDAGTCNG